VRGKKKELAAEVRRFLIDSPRPLAHRELKPVEVWQTPGRSARHVGHREKNEPQETETRELPSWPNDPSNIFARILRGEIPQEDLARIHTSRLLLTSPAGEGRIALGDRRRRLCLHGGFHRAGRRRGDRRLHPRRGQGGTRSRLEESGYRILANHGPDSHQGRVPALPCSYFGGQRLGRMISAAGLEASRLSAAEIPADLVAVLSVNLCAAGVMA